MAIIKQLPLDERPREKAMLYGAETLSDAELLAILLKNGYRGCSAIRLATILLDEFHGLHRVFLADEQKLLQIKGINQVKLIELKAVQQIFYRMKKKENTHHYYIHSSKDVYDHFQAHLFSFKQEKLMMLGLNVKNKMLKEEVLFIGNDKEMIIDRRIICKKALDMNAVKIILVHNHPSGDSTPSFEDIEATKLIEEALKLINIRLLDHIIIGKSEYYSIIDQIKYHEDKN